jgi:hypothetical protein
VVVINHESAKIWVDEWPEGGFESVQKESNWCVNVLCRAYLFLHAKHSRTNCLWFHCYFLFVLAGFRIRLSVLSTFGGVWVDASSFATSPVESWVDCEQGQVPWLLHEEVVKHHRITTLPLSVDSHSA